jgi:hypothetical protein
MLGLLFVLAGLLAGIAVSASKPANTIFPENWLGEAKCYQS